MARNRNRQNKQNGEQVTEQPTTETERPLDGDESTVDENEVVETEQPEQTPEEPTIIRGNEGQEVYVDEATFINEEVLVDPTPQTSVDETPTIDNTANLEEVVPVVPDVVQDTLADEIAKAEESSQAFAEKLKSVETPKVEKARETKTIGNGVTMASPKVETSKLVYKEACDVPTFLKKKYGLDEADYPQRLKNTIRGINDYISNMRNGVPVNPDAGAKHQANWLRTILGALDTSQEEAMVCFDTIMFVASKHPVDLFNDRLAARFFNRLHDAVQPLFLALQKDIVNGCNVRNRQQFLSNTVIENTVRLLKNQQQQTNYLAYWSK